MDIFMLAEESCLFILKVNRTPVEMYVAYSMGFFFPFPDVANPIAVFEGKVVKTCEGLL